MNKKIIQLTSGKGPAECERVVYLLLEKLKKELSEKQLTVEEMELISGKQDRTYLSAVIKITGEHVTDFCLS